MIFIWTLQLIFFVCFLWPLSTHLHSSLVSSGEYFVWLDLYIIRCARAVVMTCEFDVIKVNASSLKCTQEVTAITCDFVCLGLNSMKWRLFILVS